MDRRKVRAEFERRFTAARMARAYVAAYRALLAPVPKTTEIAEVAMPPRSQPMKARLSNAVSNRSVFARRCSRETAMLRRVNDVSFDTMGPRPARQPGSVATSLKGHGTT